MALSRVMSIAVLFLAVLVSSTFSTQRGSHCLSAFASYAEELMHRDENARATWAMKVQTAANSTHAATTLYEHNSAKLHIPASNMKLLTTFTAFNLFPSSYRFGTNVYENGTHLCVYGKGDPSHTSELLTQIAHALYLGGVHTASELLLDPSYVYGEGVPFVQSWEYEDLLADYGAMPDSFILDENAMLIQAAPGSMAGDPIVVSVPSHPALMSIVEVADVGAVTSAAGSLCTFEMSSRIPSDLSAGPQVQISGSLPVDSAPVTVYVSVLNSSLYYGTVLHGALKGAGVSVPGGFRVSPGACAVAEEDVGDHRGGGWKKVTTILSPESVGSMLNHTLQVSDNLYAEAFLRLIGNNQSSCEVPVAPTAAGGRGSATEGAAAVEALLKGHGVDTSYFLQADGSGLSRRNLVAPKALCELLQAVLSLNPQRQDEFVSYLPVGGKSGTLAHRFVGTPAEGRVHAKTGTMTGVNSLSGLLRPAKSSEYGTIVFSVIVNSSRQPATVIRKGIDELVVYLSQLQRC